MEANSKYNTKFIIVGKEEGCPNCKNLESFLQYAMQGKYDDQITKVTKESNPEDYDTLIGQTGAMSVPVIINTENDKFITGFNTPDVVSFLKA